MFKLVFLFVLVQKCVGDIYLDEEEYEKMPPLFGLDSNYDSCLREPDGVYCLAKFDLDGDPHNELLKMIREYSAYDLKTYNHSYIERAVCVTKSCKPYIQDETALSKPTDLQRTLETCINNSIWTEYGLEAKLSHIYYCDTHGDQMSVDYGDCIFAAFVLLLLAINLIGSIYDICQTQHRNKTSEDGNPYLLSFSIFRNWDQLTNINVDPQYDSMKGIHGLKSITTFFINIAHVMWLVANGFTDNPREFEVKSPRETPNDRDVSYVVKENVSCAKVSLYSRNNESAFHFYVSSTINIYLFTAYDRYHYQVIFGGMVIVQIFFVMSGCLLAFHLQRISENKPLTWNMIPKILFFRWVRLTPANAFIILFSATWLRHLGSGPFWTKYILSMYSHCRAHWWKHLLYLNNYVKEDQCCVHTWHVASDVQLFTAGLIVYMVSTKRRYPTLAIFGLIGVVAPALHVWLQNMDALPIHRPEFYREFGSDTFWLMHIRGHNNISCYAIGMAVGLASYCCIKNNIKYSNNKFLKLLTWSIPLGVLGLFWISGSLFFRHGYQPHVLFKMAFAAIQRPALGVMISLLILSLVLKFENGIRSVLEWPIWVFTSRLSYSIYLIHLNFVYVLLGSRTQLAHVSFFYVLINHFGVVSLTFVTSIPFYLMIEAPVRSLVRIYTENSLKIAEKKSN